MPTIYLDCDGVLADFDASAEHVFGMPPKEFEQRFGPRQSWSKLVSLDNFFGELPLLPDAMELYEAVRHLQPIILTGLPRGNWAEPQKRRWADRHFPGVEVITTRAALKREHCRPGDALVDDREKYPGLWEQAGRTFIYHRDAASSIRELRARDFF
ncbi:hypothetical protein [Methylobacterium sp. CM6257]